MQTEDVERDALDRHDVVREAVDHSFRVGGPPFATPSDLRRLQVSDLRVRQCFYSVPVRFAGGRMDVRLGAERVEALDGKSVAADHARAVAKETEVLVLDHPATA